MGKFKSKLMETQGSVENSHKLNEQKDDIRSAHIYFNFFHKTVNSHNLETTNKIAQVIFGLQRFENTLVD